MLHALGWNRLVKYDFLGAPKIFPWSTIGVKDPSWIITFTTCRLYNCCTWFLIWWEFLNCPFLATLTSPDCLDWPWYTPKPPSKKVARFFVKGPQATFAWCHLLSLEKGNALHFQAWPISKNAPKFHGPLPRSAFCSGGHRFLGRFWDATCALGCMWKGGGDLDALHRLWWSLMIARKPRKGEARFHVIRWICASK